MILIVALAITASIASAQAPPARADTVIFDLVKPVDDFRNFNWYTRRARGDDALSGGHQAMWEPLFLLDYDTGKLEPWLGLSLTPKDPNNPVEWTLTLRRGIEWSDSTPAAKQPFDADDVIFTVNMVLQHDSLNASEAATLRSQVASVEKPTPADPSNLKVVFKLNKANPRFAIENFGAGLFGSFLIMPQHIWKDAVGVDAAGKPRDPADFKFANPIGTGPYKLKDPSRIKMTWVRDPNWWGIKKPPGFGNDAFKKKLPDPQQLEWQVFDSETKSKAGLIANNIDAAREFTPANFADAKANNAKIIGWDTASALAWNDPCGRQLDINTKYVVDGKPTPWSDPKFRKALSLLIDRSTLANKVYGDAAVPSRTMFPEYGAMKPFIDAVVAGNFGLPPKADIAAGQKVLTDAGYAKDNADGLFKKDTKAIAASILVNADNPQDVAAGNELAKQLRDAGVDAKAVSMRNDDYAGQAIPEGSYEIVYGWLSCGSVTDPYASMARYATPAAPLGKRSPGFDNTGRWDGPKYDAYAAVVTNELGKRPVGHGGVPDLVKKAYQILDEEMPFIPLVQTPRIMPFNTTFWTGWPAKGGQGVPLHHWAATQRLIHGLKKVP
ncbi:ABC transporter substrate-binding protein (plasmid) [Bradyrhizobium barranii subsp. barranii]|uniref:ABC transporter substrate-binding protein n=1 Tax=Bradyrhizobium barranii subsp. barranii TaxID=2823807 RepID=A0A7Z0QMP6_9BRAD|nr:ABC transporter substrate-binding protein [Bradyrhizobium barranii]UGX89720.1 ABC transporter substrate-binding protein [Bradyrhizobium barranii subsp. barranii]